MADAVAASLHYLSIFILFALLTAEHLLFKPVLDATSARRLLRVDIAYGISAGLVLATGATRVLWYGKGLTTTCRTACSTPKSACSFSSACCPSCRP